MDAEVYPTRREAIQAALQECAASGGGRVHVHQPDCRSEFGGRCDCEVQSFEVEAGAIVDPGVG